MTLTATNSGFRQQYLTVFQQQMRACGMRVILNPQPADWFFGEQTGLAWRDFELAAYAWVTQAEPGGMTLYACDQIPQPSNGWQGQNFMGWCNPAASAAIKLAADTSLDRATRKSHYATVIDELAKDVPSIPLFARWPLSGDGTDTWEHIDINLETFSDSAPLAPQSAAVMSFTDFSGNTGQIAVPAHTVGQPSTLVYTPLGGAVVAVKQRVLMQSFRLQTEVAGVPQPGFAFAQPVSLALRYGEGQVVAAKEATVRLHWWSGTEWVDAAETCGPGGHGTVLDPVLNGLTTEICATGEFSVQAEWRSTVWLPMLSR